MNPARTGPIRFDMPYVIGLTGGIATGKSTVARLFADAGMGVIDADAIARRVVKKPLPAWQEIVDRFGNSILAADGEIDRGRLGDLVFEDPLKKEALNRIVHPRVFSAMADAVERMHRARPDRRILLDVPLLIETGMHQDLPLTLLVYAPEPVQIHRLMLRDGLSRQAAVARVHSQMPIEAKRQLVDIVIDNGGDRKTTRRQVNALCRRIQAGELPTTNHPESP